MSRTSSRRGSPGYQRLVEHRGGGDDGGQDVVEVVGEPACQPADSVHLLGLTQTLLERAPLGDVVEGHTDELLGQGE